MIIIFKIKTNEFKGLKIKEIILLNSIFFCEDATSPHDGRIMWSTRAKRQRQVRVHVDESGSVYLLRVASNGWLSLRQDLKANALYAVLVYSMIAFNTRSSEALC